MNTSDDFQNNLLPVLLTGASIPSLIWLQRTRSKRRLENLMEALDPSTGEITGHVWLRLEGRRGGRPATLRFESGSRGRTRRLHLFLDSGSALTFRARLEDLQIRALEGVRWIDALQRLGEDVLGRYSPKRANLEAVRNVFEQMDVIARSAEGV